MDFVEVIVKSPEDGGSIVVELYGDSAGEAEFGVQLVKLASSRNGEATHQVSDSSLLAAPFTQDAATGRQTAVISNLDMGGFNRLGLIITRLDGRESSDPVGAYTLVVRPIGATELAAAANE
jgi:hypothetical protein